MTTLMHVVFYSKLTTCSPLVLSSKENVLVLLTLHVKLLLSHKRVFLQLGNGLPLIRPNALDSFVTCLLNSGHPSSVCLSEALVASVWWWSILFSFHSLLVKWNCWRSWNFRHVSNSSWAPSMAPTCWWPALTFCSSVWKDERRSIRSPGVIFTVVLFCCIVL